MYYYNDSSLLVDCKDNFSVTILTCLQNITVAFRQCYLKSLRDPATSRGLLYLITERLLTYIYVTLLYPRKLNINYYKGLLFISTPLH